MYTTWKWSTGEAYYKSARQEKNEQKQEVSYDSQLNAINQSLADDSFFNQDSDLINITNSMFSRNQNANGTRREDLDTKIADRQMIAQRGINPFLQTSYVNDVVAQNMFLKPINTTFERSNEKSKEESS
jgi:hypothetical protein